MPARLVHHRGALVAEVIVVGLEGPDGQELPQDFVGFATADLSLMGEEHEVQLSLPVKLEPPNDAHPTFEGLAVVAALDQGPICRETILDPDEVPVLVNDDVGMLELLQDPDGPELHLARSPMVQSCCCGRSSTVFLQRFATIVGCRPSALPAEGPEVHDALEGRQRPDEGRQQCGHEARWRNAWAPAHDDQM